MFKKIITRLFAFIVKPADAWKAFSEQKEVEDKQFLSDYIYPILGCIALAAFLGVLFGYKEFSLEIAIKSSIKELISTMGGYFLAVYLLNELLFSLFGFPRDLKRAQYFVGYASSLLFVLAILLSLFPQFFFFRIFAAYTFYIVWEGAAPYYSIPDALRFRFTAITSLIIVLTPLAINLFLFFLMPGLRF